MPTSVPSVLSRGRCHSCAHRPSSNTPEGLLGQKWGSPLLMLKLGGECITPPPAQPNRHLFFSLPPRSDEDAQAEGVPVLRSFGQESAELRFRVRVCRRGGGWRRSPSPCGVGRVPPECHAPPPQRTIPSLLLPACAELKLPRDATVSSTYDGNVRGKTRRFFRQFRPPPPATTAFLAMVVQRTPAVGRSCQGITGDTPHPHPLGHGATVTSTSRRPSAWILIAGSPRP